MKRDIDLIRNILLKVESEYQPPRLREFNSEDFPDNDWNIVYEHLGLLEQAGFLESRQQDLSGDNYMISGLTWEGHDFLDSVRDSETWKRTKQSVRDLGNASFDIVIGVARAYAKSKFRELTGLEI